MDYIHTECDKEIVRIPLVLTPGERVALVVQCDGCSKELGNLCEKAAKSEKKKKKCGK